MELQGQTALVTGGARRIGRAICEALAHAGCRVVIHCRTSLREADELQQSIIAAGGWARTVQGDLATERGCFEVMDRAVSHSGGVNLLVNNAAVFRRTSWAEVREESALDEFRINLLAPLFLIRELAARTGRGAVVNLLDRRVAGHAVEAVPYALSKKALQELTALAALQWAPGIRVNAVAPGAILPPPDDAAGTAMKKNAARTPLKFNPSPDAVAEAVLFALRADAMTGQVIFVDAGSHLVAM